MRTSFFFFDDEARPHPPAALLVVIANLFGQPEILRLVHERPEGPVVSALDRIKNCAIGDDILQRVLPRLVGERDDAVDLENQRLAVSFGEGVERVDKG